MNKLLAVIRREYVERVRTKMFIVLTILGPFMLAIFTVVPGLLFSKKTDATRIAIVDQTDKLSNRVRTSILTDKGGEDSDAPNSTQSVETINANVKDRATEAGNIASVSFVVETVNLEGRPLEQIERELNLRISKNQLDCYLVLPKDILKSGKAEFYGRNTADVITRGQIERRLSQAVREQRMADENISEARVRELSKPVEMSAKPINDKGEVGAEDSGSAFFLVFILGFMIYITIIMYGQFILGAVIEEKETRIIEVLFSSVRSFTLMIGKLIGVSLVALTQYAIWGLAFAAFALYGVGMLVASGVDFKLPSLPASMFVYFFVFLLLGYFLYATLYAVIGSMVTTAQEGGMVAMPVLFTLVMGFYMAFPIIRSPNSTFAFWVSLVPFFSPITMMVRIVTQKPPFWQIALSLLIGFVTVLGMIWLASRIYRVGMLMYGKRATIPEVLRWVRRA
jgi:ABC-2 type transport system permease protein